MSLSDRVIVSPKVSDRRVRLGDPSSRTAITVDLRPQSVQEEEARHAREVATLRAAHQQAIEAAYQRGYNDGSVVTRDEAARELERKAQFIAALTTEFARTRSRWFSEYEAQAIELVCLSVEQILGDRPPIAERIQHVFQQAMTALEEGDRARIRCHPQDLPFIEEAIKAGDGQANGTTRIRLISDASVGVGGCVVESDLGIVDARIEQQLRILRGVLRDAAESMLTGQVPQNESE